MKTVSFPELAINFEKVLDSVADGREPVIVTRVGQDPVVIVPLDEYQSIVETAYLMRSPENNSRLLSAVKRMEQAGGKPTNSSKLNREANS